MRDGRAVAGPGRLALSSVTIGVALGVYLPFVAVVLNERGLTVAEVGLVMALGSVGYTIAVPLFGHVADVAVGRPRMLSLVGILGAAAIGAIAIGLPPPLTAILYVTGTLFVSTWLPLNDAIIVNALHDGRRYSRTRMLLSLAYAIAAAGAGVLYAQTGFTLGLVALAAGGVATAVVATILPDVGGSAAVPGGAVGRTGPVALVTASARHAFAAAPTLPLVLAAIGLVALAYVAGNTFLGLRLLELGGGSVDVAISAASSAAVEVPALIVAGLIGARFGLRVLFTGSAAIVVAVAVSWSLATVVEQVVVARAVIGVAYAGLMVTGVVTMRMLLPAELQGTGQTLFQATTFGVTGIVVNAAGGLLHAAVGYRGLFAVFAALGVVGIGVGWRAFGAVSRSGAGTGANMVAVRDLAAVTDLVPPGPA